MASAPPRARCSHCAERRINFPADRMEAYRVSAVVGNVKKNDASLVEIAD